MAAQVTQETYEYVEGKRNQAQANADSAQTQLDQQQTERDLQLGYVAQWNIVLADLEVV